MGFGLPNNKLSIGYDTPNAAGLFLNTLESINKVRASYLENEKNKSTLPYAAPQAEANVGETNARTNLLGQQAQFFPVTAGSALLGNAAKAGLAFNPMAAFKYADPNTRSQAVGAMINGAQGLGSVPFNNQNYSGISGLVSQLLNKFPALLNNAGSNLLGNQNYGKNLSNRYPSTPIVPLNNINDVSNLDPEQLKKLAEKDPRINQMTDELNNTNPEISSGMTNSNQTPYSSKEQLDAYNAQHDVATQNQLASSTLQRKANYAINLAKTFQKNEDQYGIPPVAFSRYMGLEGAAKLKADLAGSSVGANKSLANKYIAFTKNLPILREQFRQFFGGSVSPAAQKEMEKVFEPTNWMINPSAAMMAYNNLRSIMHTEGNTATAQVAKGDQFNKIFPEYNSKNLYSSLQKNPNIAKDIISTLSESQKNDLKNYHESLKKGLQNG